MKSMFAAAAMAAVLTLPNAAAAGVTLVSLDPTYLDTIDTSDVGASIPAGIRFVNELDYAVDLFWINYSGDRVFYATIAAFGIRLQSTFTSHPWILARSGTATLAQGTGELVDGFIALSTNPATFSDYDVAYIRGAFAAVPEPSTWALAIAGFGLAGAGLRRRSRTAVPA
ncbi:MAG: PEPxxWA-CTERM sorting domain-containing protein [Pseudomonadota bacterium]